jgi:hypothetical protein
MTARTATASASAPTDWQLQTPRYKASRDLWPPSKPQFRHLPPTPCLSEADDIWQFANRPIAAGNFINTEDWPHWSFEPINESARHVHGYFLAHKNRWMPLRPFEEGRLLPLIVDSGDAA